MLIEFVLLVGAGFLAGILNTIAGGGTFLTLPALIFSGVPPVAANATSTVAVFPGYVGAVAGYRSELASISKPKLLKLSLLCAVGGCLGSCLLLVSSDEAFSMIVPVLLAASTLVFAYGERLQNWSRCHKEASSNKAVGSVLVSVYGGYFNGGLGIVLLALFSTWGMRDFNEMNALKNGVSLLVALSSVFVFSVSGLIAWPSAITMMIATIAGGYAGAPLSKTLPQKVLRKLVVLIGASMSVVFLLKALV